MEDLEKKTREIARMVEEAAKELAKPKPLLSEYFGDVGRVEIFGRSEDGERFIAELGPPTRITAQVLPRKFNPFRETLWEIRTWDNWAVQLVHYHDTGKVYLFLNHGPHYTAKLMDEHCTRDLRNSAEKALRRLKRKENQKGSVVSEQAQKNLSHVEEQ